MSTVKKWSDKILESMLYDRDITPGKEGKVEAACKRWINNLIRAVRKEEQSKFDLTSFRGQPDKELIKKIVKFKEKTELEKNEKIAKHSPNLIASSKSEFFFEKDKFKEVLKRQKKTVMNKSMVTIKTWKEFQNSGLLWWTNRILHTFGWAIVLLQEDDGSISDVCPARCKFRGFSAESETKGFSRLHKYLKKNMEKLQKETEENE
jgi:hypothetical protein